MVYVFALPVSYLMFPLIKQQYKCIVLSSHLDLFKKKWLPDVNKQKNLLREKMWHFWKLLSKGCVRLLEAWYCFTASGKRQENTDSQYVTTQIENCFRWVVSQRGHTLEVSLASHSASILAFLQPSPHVRLCCYKGVLPPSPLPVTPEQQKIGDWTKIYICNLLSKP